MHTIDYHKLTSLIYFLLFLSAIYLSLIGAKYYEIYVLSQPRGQVGCGVKGSLGIFLEGREHWK